MQPVTSLPQRHPSALDRRSEVDFVWILNTLRRGKWIIGVVTALAILLGGFYVFRLAQPLYTATAVVALNARSTQFVDLANPVAALEGDWLTINTEVETLVSRTLIGKLVDQENLIAEPEINGRLRPVEAGGFSPIRALTGLMGSLFEVKEDVVVVEPSPEEIRDEVIDTVLGMLNVSVVSNTYAFSIEAVHPDPDTAKRIANALAVAYRNDQIEVKYEKTQEATLWLQDRVDDLKVKLVAAESAVKDFKSSTETDLVGPEALEALNRQLKDRRDRVDSTKAQTKAMGAQLEAMQAAKAAGDRPEMARLADDAALTRMVPRLGQAGVAAAFDVRFEQALKRVQFEAERSATQIGMLETSVATLAAQVKDQSQELLELEERQREAAANRQLYEYFLGRLKETSAQTELRTADSRILSPAVRPRFPTSPRKARFLVFAALAGFFLSALYVMTREMRKTGFRSAQEAEQATGMTVIAQIPKAPVNRRRQVLSYLISRPASAFNEAVRNLRTSVLMSSIDKAPQVIMVTSSLPSEGKTTQSLSLAQSFSGLEKRVLLIEGDIRRRTFQKYFRLAKQPGLLQAVSGAVPLEEAVMRSDEMGFDVLAGEQSSVNAADFFSSAKFKAFLDTLRRNYDVIIIDTPPVLLVPDARVIGKMADAVIYVVHWDKTTRLQVQEGLRSLNTVDVKVLGLSLSQIDMRRVKSYGGKYTELYGGYGGKYYKN